MIEGGLALSARKVGCCGDQIVDTTGCSFAFGTAK